jgi:hypothetical protein
MNEQPISNIPMMVVDVKALPSRGLGYPEGCTVKYRGYTFGEIKSVSVTNDVEFTTLMELVLSGVEVEGFDKMKLSFIDVLYIGLLRRVSSQGHLKYEMPYQCEECGNVGKALFGSTDIEFQDIKEEVTALPLVVEIGGKEMHFSYPTVANIMEVKTASKSAKTRKQSRALHVTASSVLNMNTEEAYNHLSKLTDQDDIELLEEIDKMLYHEISDIKAVCKFRSEDGKVCGHENMVSIEGKELLAKPFRDGETSIRSKIRFGE